MGQDQVSGGVSVLCWGILGFQVSDANKGDYAHFAYDSYMPIFDIFVAVESIYQYGFYCYKG